MFKALGMVLAVYVLVSAWRGHVVAKAGAGRRDVRRDDTPGYFWAVITVYAGLALALIFVF